MIKFNFDVNTSRSSAEIFTRKLEFGTNSTDISNKIKFQLCNQQQGAVTHRSCWGKAKAILGSSMISVTAMSPPRPEWKR